MTLKRKIIDGKKAWLEETEERNQKFIFADVLLERREEK